MKKIVFSLLTSMFIMLPQILFSEEAKITAVSGSADVKSAQTDSWYAAKSGINVKSGQIIKTKARSRVKVSLADGSRIEVLPNSQIDLQEVKPSAPSFKMMIGKLKAWVSKNRTREKFEVRTPVAVCSVRGTEFSIEVDEKGSTDIEVYKGLVGVRKADDTGEEIPVGAGEKLNVTEDKPITIEQKAEALSEEKIIRHEVGLEMNKEQVQAAAAAELKSAEYQEGKTMIDVFGYRVRLEEYIMRPAADTFKLVVLNERDNRFDYFYYKGKFNKDLPSDLSTALKDMGGKLGVDAPEYYLTEYEQVYSNTQDYSKDTGAGGHLVKIVYNSNGTFTLTDNNDLTNTKTVNIVDSANGAYNPITDTFDASATTAAELKIFNPSTDAFETFSAGQTFWKTRFNSYQHVLDDIKKQWYLPSSTTKNILAADLDGHWLYPSKDSAGNTVYGEWGESSTALEHPDVNKFHDKITINYYDGTYEQYNTYIISDDGKMASYADFSNITSGTQYKEQLLKWNYQQVLTASEFGDRKIDLVIEPKILIKSGIIK